MIAGGLGRAIAFRLAPGQAMNCPTPFPCSTNCRVCPSGSSETAALYATDPERGLGSGVSCAAGTEAEDSAGPFDCLRHPARRLHRPIGKRGRMGRNTPVSSTAGFVKCGRS